jgi:nucleoside phosphorylase
MARLLIVAATPREIPPDEGADSLCCGIGPVEAALATSRELAALRHDGVLHVGIAGAATLEPGTVVIGTEAVYCDVIDANATLPRVDRVLPAAGFVDAALDCLPQAQALPIATCARVGGGTLCEVEAMEGFGVLRAASLAGRPALEVRVISNAVGDADRASWRIDEALATLSEVVALLRPRLLGQLESRAAGTRPALGLPRP